LTFPGTFPEGNFYPGKVKLLSGNPQKHPSADQVDKLIALLQHRFEPGRTKCYLAPKNTLKTPKKATRKPAKPVKKITLTIRAWTQPEIDALILIKKLTQTGSYSAALMTAAREYEKMHKLAESRYDMITKLQNEMRHSDQVLKMLSSGSKMLEAYSKKYLGKFPEPTFEGF
jgi:hypothetical protein